MCVAMMGDLGRENAEVVRLDTYVGLMNKSNDRLELKYAELDTTITAWRRNRLCTAERNLNSVLQAPRRRRLVMTYVDEICNLFLQEERVRLT